MKIKFLTIAALSTLLLAWGCSDDWLNDIEPQGKLLQVNYYETEEEFENGLISVYSMLKNQYFHGVWASWYLSSELQSDDAQNHQGGRGDRPELWDIAEFNTNPETAGILQVWERSYYGIYRANILIDNLNGRDNVPNSLKGMGAEARMLRAYFYFDLVRFFGECPLIEGVLTPTEYDQEKVSKETILNFIVSDLKQSIDVLPESYSGPNRYRVTKYAAIGLLGRVYTYMASPFYDLGDIYYDSAAVELKRVIDEGPYQLLADYDQVWWWENQFNEETLMEISYEFAPGDAWDNGTQHPGSVIAQLNGPRGISSNDTLTAGWGGDMVTLDLVQAYRDQEDSVRLHGTALAEWQMVEWGISGFEENEGYTGYYTKKRTTWSAQNPTDGTWGWNNNDRVLRLADIYLLYAEVMNRKGEDDEARTYVNLVRDRVGLDPVTSSGDDLYEDIKLERRLELAKEGHRFFDLVRWGDAPTVLGPLGFQANKNEHFPIPQAEIDNSNGALTQNPGY